MTQQELTTHVYPPSGWTTGRVIIGSTFGGDSYVYYVANLSGSGTCSGITQIGSAAAGGLFNRTRVHGSGGPDEMRVVYGSENFAGCAGQPVLFDFLGGKLELYGEGGNDIVYDPHPDPNRQMYGGAGNDRLQAGQAYVLNGESGQDTLIAMGNESSPWTSIVDSSNSNDLLCAYGNKIFDMNGGAGTDKGWYVTLPQNLTSIETVLGSSAECDAAVIAISGLMFD